MPEETVRLLTPLGNALCLDFANTVEPRGVPEGHEFLTGYADLVHWSVHVGSIDAHEGAKLRAMAAREPAPAQRIFRGALGLREAISRSFEAIAERRAPRPRDLDEIAGCYKARLRDTKLAPTGGGGFDLIAPNKLDLSTPLWPIVASAVELLTRGELGLVRFCAGDCRWLFLDVSKNHSRRWCSMAVCGSRDKMRRHYARHSQHRH